MIAGMRWLLVFVAACSFSTSVSVTPPGDGDPEAIDAPMEAIDSYTPPGCKAVEIEAMSAQTCVLRSDGEVWCWGRNADGAIGVPSTATCAGGDPCVRVPTKLTFPAGQTITQLGMGDRHSCAMSTAKTYCWGFNGNGQFGDNSTNSATSPREIALRNGSTILRGGDLHTCAIKGTSIHCSGRNQFGEIGDMSTTQRETPTAAGLAGIPTALGAGFHHTCAIVGGAVSCWGQNTSGQIDASGNNPVTSPRLSGVTSAGSVAGGTAHTCARLVTGAIMCWGGNGNGQLGVGNTNPQTGPQLLGLTQVSQIAAGVNHTCALVGTGVWCWGEGFTAAPTQVNFGGMGAIAIAAGSYHDCAIMMDGTVRCWGANPHGQLGNNSTTTSATPVPAVVCP
jgi:alpha-tubulin suppressor-like RCC1 family protein